METRLPRVSTYGFGILPYALQLARLLMENVGTNMAWWTANVQPLLEPLVWPIAPAFLLGLFIQDLYNKKSWIRENWRNWTRKFEVVFANVGYAEEPRRLDVRTQIRFVKNIPSAQLTLRVYSCIGLNRPPFVHAISIAKLTDIIKDQIQTIEIAKLAIPFPGWIPFHSSWGPGAPDHRKALIGGSKNVVEIELTGSFIITQRHRFFVANLTYGGPQDMPSLYLQDEDEDVFKVS